MSFLRRILGIETRAVTTTAELARLLEGARETSAGISVTPETALRCAPVAACARVLTEAISQLPLHLYRRTADGGKERATDHPLAALVHGSVNDWTSSAEWRATAMMQLVTRGESFSWIGRGGGRVVELVNAPAGTVTTDWTTGEPMHRATMADGSHRIVDRSELLWLRLPGPDPRTPLSLVDQAREAIALSLAMEGYAGRLFARGARPSGVIHAPGRLQDATIKRLNESLRAMHAGQNSGGTAVFEDGAKFEALQFSSVDLQFLELRRHQIAEIARVFRVPLHLVQELERTTHNNAEHMGQQFLSLTVLPWLHLWQQALARDLLTEAERGEYFFEFLTDDLARADLASRMTAYVQAVTNGVLTSNECRVMENRPPLPGGDDLRVPLNTEPAGGQSDD